MAYAQGDLITDATYNTLLTSTSSPHGINHIAGTGSGEYGLGETSLSTVSDGTTVKAASWNALFTLMDNVANHTNDSISSTAQRAAGDQVAFLSALQTDLTSLAAEVAGGSTSATALTTSSALQTASASGAYTGSHIVEQSVTFASADRMRHFFNAGGKVRVAVDRTGNGGTGGGATAKDTSYDAMFTALGNLDIGGQVSTRSGSGETLETDGLANGFHDLGTSYTTIILLNDATSPYTDNDLKVEAKLNAAVGTGVTITVKVSVIDGSADSTYSANNLSSVDQTPDRVGVTRVRLYTLTPNDTQGLSNTLSASGNAGVSNSTS
jgi:hypothetical protein